MENGGNAKVNAIFEARLGQSGATKPTTIADGHTRERFIRDKYERRKYYDEQAYHTSAAQVQPDPQDISLPAMKTGPPSDAARQRMEERRGRMKKSSSNVSTESTDSTTGRIKPRGVKKSTGGSGAGRKPAVARAPASAPPPSMDLLDMTEPEQPTHALASEHAQSFQDTKAEMFDFLNSNTNTNHFASMGSTDIASPGGGGGGGGLMDSSDHDSRMRAANAAKQPASLDIMSLYNTGGSGQQQQQQAFNTNSNNPLGNHMSGLMQQMSINNQQSGNNNNGMMNNHHQQQQPNNNMMNMNYQQQPQQQQQQSMNQQQQMYQQQMMMQQQQQQRQMMMNQQGQQQGNQGGGMMNNNNSNNNNNMMNMQQGGMQQNNNGGGGFGAPMGSGPPISSMQSNNSRKEPKQPEKQDPFADFGMNAFR
jgi:hypothetical protein